jgi:hypothetical protein
VVADETDDIQQAILKYTDTDKVDKVTLYLSSP